ncbi:MAG: TlpA family protein disulfide reductase [Solirubrobacteraceae bacterium]
MPTAWIVLFIVLWIAVLALLTLVLGLSQRVNAMEKRGFSIVEDDPFAGMPAVGTRAPVDLPDGSLLISPHSESTIMLFLSSTCEPCKRLGSSLREAHLERGGLREFLGAEIVIITDPPGFELYEDTGATRLLADDDGAIARGFGVRATPVGVAIDTNGIVRGVGVTNGLADLESLAAACTDVELKVIAAP